MPLFRPSDTVGAMWVSYCLDQAYIATRQNVANRDFIFFREEQQNHVVICHIFVVKRDKKITIHNGARGFG